MGVLVFNLNLTGMLILLFAGNVVIGRNYLSECHTDFENQKKMPNVQMSQTVGVCVGFSTLFYNNCIFCKFRFFPVTHELFPRVKERI